MFIHNNVKEIANLDLSKLQDISAPKTEDEEKLKFFPELFKVDDLEFNSIQSERLAENLKFKYDLSDVLKDYFAQRIYDSLTVFGNVTGEYFDSLDEIADFDNNPITETLIDSEYEAYEDVDAESLDETNGIPYKDTNCFKIMEAGFKDLNKKSDHDLLSEIKEYYFNDRQQANAEDDPYYNVNLIETEPFNEYYETGLKVIWKDLIKDNQEELVKIYMKEFIDFNFSVNEVRDFSYQAVDGPKQGFEAVSAFISVKAAEITPSADLFSSVADSIRNCEKHNKDVYYDFEELPYDDLLPYNKCSRIKDIFKTYVEDLTNKIAFDTSKIYYTDEKGYVHPEENKCFKDLCNNIEIKSTHDFIDLGSKEPLDESTREVLTDFITKYPGIKVNPTELKHDFKEFLKDNLQDFFDNNAAVILTNSTIKYLNKFASGKERLQIKKNFYGEILTSHEYQQLSKKERIPFITFLLDNHNKMLPGAIKKSFDIFEDFHKESLDLNMYKSVNRDFFAPDYLVDSVKNIYIDNGPLVNRSRQEYFKEQLPWYKKKFDKTDKQEQKQEETIKR